MLRLKWWLFRALEWLSHVRARGGGSRRTTSAAAAVSVRGGPGSLWVFVSTIGELNAIEPFLRALSSDLSPLQLLLVTDRNVYRDSYAAKFPTAEVHETDGSIADIEQLLRAAPPRLLLIAEIPCLLSDAPCRFPFAMVYLAKRSGAAVALVNGWLYGQQPQSRIDLLERALFGSDYPRLMDLITVQSEETRARLIAAGAKRDGVFVTGNIKFDAMTRQAWTPAGTRSETLLRSMVASGRPCLVAGCVTELEDQLLILDAFRLTRARVPHALLVLVPRHPEEKQRLRQLETVLAERDVAHTFRTRLTDQALPPGMQCLVVDTMGELRDFYAAGTTAYVGRDHNILEPLAFGKPVAISPGWDKNFPSYPVYELLLGLGAMAVVHNADELAAEWIRLLSEPDAYRRRMADIETALEGLKGASERNLALMRRHQLVPGAYEHRARVAAGES